MNKNHTLSKIIKKIKEYLLSYSKQSQKTELSIRVTPKTLFSEFQFNRTELIKAINGDGSNNPCFSEHWACVILPLCVMI